MRRYVTFITLLSQRYAEEGNRQKGMYQHSRPKYPPDVAVVSIKALVSSVLRHLAHYLGTGYASTGEEYSQACDEVNYT